MMGTADLSPHSHTSATTKLSGRALTAAVIFLFLISIFIIFLFIYIKNNWIPLFSTHNDAPIPNRGLSADALRSLPTNVFQRRISKDGIECSVCLCELSDGDKFRLLPKCNHGFHLDCIDMWLHSHFTCPLCRCPVGPVAAADGDVSRCLSGSPALSTNVVLWRNSGRFSTRGLSAYSGRSLVVTIPSGFCDGLPVEELRSTGTLKFKSLRRILSRGRRSGGSCCSSPVEGDVEQGLGRCRIGKEEGSSVYKASIST